MEMEMDVAMDRLDRRTRPKSTAGSAHCVTSHVLRPMSYVAGARRAVLPGTSRIFANIRPNPEPKDEDRKEESIRFFEPTMDRRIRTTGGRKIEGMKERRIDEDGGDRRFEELEAVDRKGGDSEDPRDLYGESMGDGEPEKGRTTLTSGGKEAWIRIMRKRNARDGLQNPCEMVALAVSEDLPLPTEHARAVVDTVSHPHWMYLR